MEIKDCGWINKLARSFDWASIEFFHVEGSLDAPEWLPAGAMIRVDGKGDIADFGQQQIVQR